MTEIEELLHQMRERGASDLFVSAEISPHLKINGTTRPAMRGSATWPTLVPGESQRFAYELMSAAQREEFERTKECNFALTTRQGGRYRVNVYYQRGEVSMVIRLIKTEVPSFDALGLPPQVAQLALLKRGLVLMVGAAGTGKSTTMAAMVAHRATMMDGHILSVEDPIEYLYPHGRAVVEQREVGIDTLSFGDALKNAMRQAPDVIVIGEIRDRETAKSAIMYAEAGALCISTLHSNNANQAIDRIVNFFPEDAHQQVLLDLSLNLKGVVSQRLLPSPQGGLALATEVLLQSAYSSSLIQKGGIDMLKDAIKKGTNVGMQIFDDSLLELYKAGRISQEEALNHADSKTDLALKIRLLGGTHAH
jgi:twitching motility protein PilU